MSLKIHLPLKWLGVIVIYLTSNNLLAQSQDSNPLKFDVTPPSPEAAAIGKFVDNPVSAYTGVPKIDIPIYTLKSFELSLPISLSYHASGVKWEEIPSWVGSNWTLNAGGIVSRTIRGRNDEDPNFGYFLTSPGGGYDIPSFFNGGAFSSTNFNYVSPYCLPGDVPTDQYRNVLYASKGGLDLEPDQFFFSLPDGQSGKFIYSRSQQMRLIPHQFAQITQIPHPTTGKLFNTWQIIGKDGNKYFFEKQEVTVSNTPCKELYNGTPETFSIPDVDAISSWRLTRIENSSNTDFINFEYVGETISYETKMSFTTYDRVDGTLGPPGSNACINQTTVYGWRLSQITTSAGYRVEFVANTNRGDLVGAKMLDQIKIFYNSTFIKRFDLSYSGQLTVLNSIQEIFDATGNTNKIPAYEFTYYGYAPYTPTYNRNSLNVDHWGYFNGANNTVNTNAPVTYNNIYYAGANRDPNLEAAQWMTLKQVRYPTGGTVDYEYELNAYSNLPQNLDFDHLSQLELIESIEFNVTNPNPSQPMVTQTKNFSLAANEPVVLLYEIPSTGAGIPVNGLHATLTKTSGTPYSDSFVSGESQSTQAPIQTFTSGNYTLYGEFQDGVYQLGNQKFYVKVYKFKSMASLISAGQMKGGGLRIKKITSAGDNTITKTYSYVNPVTGISTGKLLSFPAYSYLAGFSDGQMQAGQCVTNNSANMLVRTSATNVPLSVSQGGHVGYSEVREYLGDATTNNGYTVYKFTNTPDIQSPFFPFVPAQAYSYKNGLLLSQEDFTTGHKLVKRTENQYTYQNDAGFVVHGAKVAQVNNSGCTGCSNRAFTYNVYAEPTERVLLTSSNTRVYDVAADNYIETTASMVYNSNDQVIERSQTLSNETVRKKYTRYVYHITFLTTPVEEYSYYSTNNTNNFEFTGGVMRNWLTPTKPTDVFLLETLPTVRTTNNPSSLGLYKQRAHVDYDNKGNVTTITRTGDPVITRIIWDSNQLLPIAQVMNAPANEIAFTSFENGANEGGWTFNLSTSTDKRAGNKSHQLTTTVTKPGLNSSKRYVVSYWAKGSEPIINGVVENNDSANPNFDNWKYYEKIVTGVPTVVLSVTEGAIIDELRLYPEGAQMTTYTHDIQKGLVASADMNQVISEYTYTNRKQLESILDFEKNILKKNEYRYARD